MTVIATIAMKCPNSKSLFYLKVVWVRASVISDEIQNEIELELLSYLINLQWDDCYSNNCDEMSKCLINLQWDDCYSNNCDFDLKWFEIELLSYLINI